MPALPPAKPSSRDHLLDAAEEVILRTGIGSLTLDAVAAHAGVSKGGLLYHFPSKDALILALVERTCRRWREDYSRAIAEEPAGPGRVARALVKMCLGSTESCSQTCRRSSVVLVAAIVNNPGLAAPLRSAHEDLRARLADDDAAPGVGEAVVLALNGLWFEQIFGLTALTPERIEAIRGALNRLIDLPGPREPGSASSKGARRGARRPAKGAGVGGAGRKRRGPGT